MPRPLLLLLLLLLLSSSLMFLGKFQQGRRMHCLISRSPHCRGRALYATSGQKCQRKCYNHNVAVLNKGRDSELCRGWRWRANNKRLNYRLRRRCYLLATAVGQPIKRKGWSSGDDQCIGCPELALPTQANSFTEDPLSAEIADLLAQLEELLASLEQSGISLEFGRAKKVDYDSQNRSGNEDKNAKRLKQLVKRLKKELVRVFVKQHKCKDVSLLMLIKKQLETVEKELKEHENDVDHMEDELKVVLKEILQCVDFPTKED